MLMDLDWPYHNWADRVHSRFQIGCCKHHVHFKQVNNDSGIIEITMENIFISMLFIEFL